jgi:hypothetical protein
MNRWKRWLLAAAAFCIGAGAPLVVLPTGVLAPGGIDNFGPLNLGTNSSTAVNIGSGTGSVTLDPGGQSNFQVGGVTKWSAASTLFPAGDNTQNLGGSSNRINTAHIVNLSSDASALTLTGGASSLWSLSAGTLELRAPTLNLCTNAACTTAGVGNNGSTTTFLGTLSFPATSIAIAALSADTYNTPSGTGLSGGGSATLGNTATAISLDVTHANTWTGAQKFPVGSSSTSWMPVLSTEGSTATASLTSGTVVGDTITVPANALSVNGQRLRITARWTHAANTNSVTANIKWDGGAGGTSGTTICQPTISTSGDTPKAVLELVRTSSSVATYQCIYNNGSTFARGTPSTLTGVDFTISHTIEDTISATTSNSDATTESLLVEWIGS